MGYLFPLPLSVTCLFFTLQFYSVGPCKQASVTLSCVAKAARTYFQNLCFVLALWPDQLFSLRAVERGVRNGKQICQCLCLRVFRGGPEERLEESCSFQPISHRWDKKAYRRSDSDEWVWGGESILSSSGRGLACPIPTDLLTTQTNVI